MIDQADWASRVVSWQKAHGRNDLPWQNTRDPYRVWLSEIMLQQTQVVTVMGYYERFLHRFPQVSMLAAASHDEVMSLWSGLGYYSRARNLHRCAKDVMALHAGQFPSTAKQLQTLPGIGPSTAAAIASLCFGERVAIMDGNVKRVLTRVLGWEADLAVQANERKLLARAEQMLPGQQLFDAMPRYTQGLMDLGATLCTPRRPDCHRCPAGDLCVAHAQGEPERFPVKTRKIKRSSDSLWLLWATDEEGQVCLSLRPAPGIWAGLYCLPLYDSRPALLKDLSADDACQLVDQPAFKHVLTHKDLHLHVVRLQVSKARRASLSGLGLWLSRSGWMDLGLPAPVRKLLLTSA